MGPQTGVMTATVPDLDLELLHDRQYSVQVYRKSDRELLARGRVRDTKPPGLYVDGDPDPLTIHDMVVDLTVAFPSFEITDVDMNFDTHPQPMCPAITESYRQLVGLSIARGYTHRLRELFGGPRGCAHVTALLQAMGPALIQSAWSMGIRGGRATEGFGGVAPGSTPDERIGLNLNTCHVWAEDAELVQRVRAGDRLGPTIPIATRLRELGRDPASWGQRA